mmetsp:Transcript_71377/g.206666  ORF Transcript_71377/g.206666 Transcript_71377/m.206666 type:complete len:252 (-) Transcript_71377:1186-1941(-)
MQESWPFATSPLVYRRTVRPWDSSPRSHFLLTRSSRYFSARPVPERGSTSLLCMFSCRPDPHAFHTSKPNNAGRTMSTIIAAAAISAGGTFVPKRVAAKSAKTIGSTTRLWSVVSPVDKRRSSPWSMVVTTVSDSPSHRLECTILACMIPVGPLTWTTAKSPELPTSVRPMTSPVAWWKLPATGVPSQLKFAWNLAMSSPLQSKKSKWLESMSLRAVPHKVPHGVNILISLCKPPRSRTTFANRFRSINAS